MTDPRKHDPDVPHSRPDPVPPMPVHLPAENADNPHTSPLRDDQDTEQPDPALPPEPGHDINP